MARGPVPANRTMVLSAAARLFFLSALVLAGAFGSARAADGGASPPRILAPGGQPAAKMTGKAAAKMTGQPATKMAGKPTSKSTRKPRAPLAAKKVKAPKKPRTTTVVLYHVNRRNTFTLRQRDMQGRLPKGYQKRFDRFLRCHYTNQQHAMNPRIVRLLYQTGRHWPGKRLDVVSGYRSPSVAKNPRSPHMKGLACDFRVEGVQNTELRDYLRSHMKKVGVGYYPNSSFVHLDVRKDRSAFWIDYSGPGERAVYSQTPAEDLKTGRADAYHPTKIGDDWVNDAPGPGSSAAADDEAEAKAGGTPPAPAPLAAPAAPTLAGQAGKTAQSATP